MGTQLATVAALGEHPKLMTLPVASALADSGGEWSPEWAKRVLARENVDPAALLAELEAGLVPVSHDWLAKRLQVLWKSSTPASSLDAKAWLHETGRLLSDLPQDLVATGIDEAVRRSLRGFMPTVGEVRAIAEPMFAERKRQLARMRRVVHGELARPRYRWEPEERDIPPEDRCTPEQAAELIRRFRLGQAGASSDAAAAQ